MVFFLPLFRITCATWNFTRMCYYSLLCQQDQLWEGRSQGLLILRSVVCRDGPVYRRNPLSVPRAACLPVLMLPEALEPGWFRSRLFREGEPPGEPLQGSAGASPSQLNANRQLLSNDLPAHQEKTLAGKPPVAHGTLIDRRFFRCLSVFVLSSYQSELDEFACIRVN